MPIDARIPLMARGVQIADPLQQAGQMEQVADLQMQNRLAEMKLKNANQPQFDKDQFAVIGQVGGNLLEQYESDKSPDRDVRWQQNYQNAVKMLSGMGVRGLPEMATPEQVKLFLQKSGANHSPYYSVIPTEKGYARFNNRTGDVDQLLVEGEPVLPASQSPELQGRVSKSKRSGTVTGEAQAKARTALMNTADQANEVVALVDELLKHPGMKQAVGKSALLGVQKVPGTDAYDFMTRLNQLRGKQFMQAYQTLKGGGQITEVEGVKAEQALARMDNAQSEAAFVKGARDFQKIIKKGLRRAMREAQGKFTPEARQPEIPAPSADVVDFGELR